MTAYVEQHGDRLKADFAEVADSGLFAPGVPTLETGLRGMVYTEVAAHGASHDPAFGSLWRCGAEPAQRARAHHRGSQGHGRAEVPIPGFYDDVEMPDAGVLQSWRELPFDEEAFLRDEIGSSALAGEPGYTQIERSWARPTLDVHGISGGFVGEGTKTVIPAEATAKISMRLVPNQDPDKIFELFKARVLELATPGIQLDVRLMHVGRPVVVPGDSRWSTPRAARSTTRSAVTRSWLVSAVRSPSSRSLATPLVWIQC